MDTVAIAPPVPSPWLTIWLSPRRTIRRVIDGEAGATWWPVVALSALGQAIGALAFDPDGSLAVSRSFMPVTIGIAQTIFGVVVGPFLLAFVGGWLGGDADPSDIRHAIVWGNVPFAVAAVGWIPLALWFRGSLSDPNADIPLALVPFMLALGVAALWSVVTQILALAEVQRFSVWRAIASVLILMIPVFLLGLL